MSPVISQFLNVLDSLGESSQFCTSGSLSPVLPGLDVHGIGNVGVPVSAADAKRLIQQASQAPYGRGEETIVDTNVRRVWQLDTSQFSLRNSAWDDFVEGIVQTVRGEFGIQKKVQHELYKLLIYEKGSFFAPHRDSEKTPGMFATLVVCLPSRHEGGTLLVTHDGETRRIEFGGSEAEFNVQYAAFYADCQHEITPVTSGYRVCLVYNLAIARQKKQPSAPENRPAVDAVAELLPQIFADPARDKIAIPFKHQYTEAALNPRELKGSDRSCMDVLKRAAERLGYQVFVALLTHHQSGTPDYGSMDYFPRRSRRRYYDDFDDDEDADDISDDNPDAQFEEVFDESRTLNYWLDPRGRKQPFGEMSLEEDEVLTNVAEEDRDYTQEIQEATGNEGASMERWYRQGVVVIWPRDRYFGILAGEGQSHAVPALEDLVAARPRDDEACRAFATEIVSRWQKSRQTHSPSDKASLTTRLLKLIEKLDAAELAARFVRDILPTDADGSEGSILARLGDRFGWPTFAEPLQNVFAKQSPGDYTSDPATSVTIFEGLCCSPPAMTAERQAVCVRIAEVIEQLIERWDSYKGREAWYRREESRSGIVELVFRAYSSIDEIDRLSQFVAHVLASPKRYDLRGVLIPAVKSLHAAQEPDSPARGSFERLLHHCLTELRSLTAVPIEPPADWTRDAPIDCKCVDCKELIRFLRDPAERVHRFPRRKELRQHLHQQIDKHGCDLTHVTHRAGSPQTLVCTKTQATYERRLAQFQVDSQHLGELENLAETDSPTPVNAKKKRPAKPKKTSTAARK